MPELPRRFPWKAALAVWLSVPLVVGAYHAGPGQERLIADRAGDRLARAQEALAAGDTARAKALLAEAASLIPASDVAAQRRIALESAKAGMQCGGLPESRDALAQLVDAIVADPQADPQLAREICAADQEIDAIHRTVYQGVYDGIRKNPDQMQPLIATLTVARHLERIADHATNIAEDVIYTVEGQITRHKILNERQGR